jgi:tRNA(Leu) C34 or U34 (ribose-2'-O)-methylase TrmL
MIRVAGLWEFGWNTPIKELDLWEYPLRDFLVDEFVMSPISGIESSAVSEIADLGHYIDHRRAAGDSVVFLDERGAVPLPDFQHPENALYVFGKSSLSAMTAYGKPGDLAVVIPTPASAGLLWPHQAAAILLYDRMRKSGAE